MFHIPDPNEVAFTGEYSQSTYRFSEHSNVIPDEIIRLNEDRQAVADSGYTDFCMPIEDWMLD
ncbi:MAG: hypothetical protein HY847_05790 [Betaproteobacteria bacterium]|nr:hypothetical protein [Betaproteobacteria bacterium]